MKKYIPLFIALTFLSCSPKNGDFERKVREAVAYQMETYPKSTLKDLYKNFFQDRFGPGHLINDTAAARNYLLRELDSFTVSSGPLLEPIGWEHNFYRVNLSAVKEGVITPDSLLNALIQSANELEPISVEEWRSEWTQIETIIRSMNLSLPHYDTDLEEITKRLAEGNYVGHHSREFNEAYSPHYRIVRSSMIQ
ncbi:MAG: hypothetical protein LBV02_07120 [Bacteroidales bacterium]|jgi:hypothetical protein|nr:hypothetical protein [Bacteroidales bacterium]